MTESEEKVYVKVPTFDGRKSKWPFFKSKMISYLAQKNMSELLSFNGNIEKDDKTWSNQEMQRDEVKQVIRMRDMNRKASGVLLNCVDTETEAGEAAFNIVEQFIDPAGGYAGGHFPKAWKAMVNRYEDQDTVDAADLKQAYYDEKMKTDERPSYFIDKMKKYRKRLANEMRYTMTDNEFMKDMLAKLPRSPGDNNLGPYQVLKRFVIDKIENNLVDFSIEDLVAELDRVYKDIHGDEDDADDEKSTKEEAAYAAYSKQFKGMCRKCGKYGHMARECRDNRNGGRHFGRGRGRGYGRGSGRGSGRSSYRNNNNKRIKGKCFHCGIIGHHEEDCRKKKAEEDRANQAIEGEVALMAYTPMDWKEESKKMLDYDGWGDDDSDESLPELICRPTNMYATDSSSSEEEDEEDGPIPQWILDVRKYNEIKEDAIVELEVYEMKSFEEVEEPTEEDEFELEKPPYNNTSRGSLLTTNMFAPAEPIWIHKTFKTLK